MAANFDDPSSWNLQLGGVPVKLIGTDGSFEPEKGSVNLKLLIPSNRLIDFITGSFPPPVQDGNLYYPQVTTLPGVPGLVAKRVRFGQHDQGKPIDPFGFHPLAPSGTYHPVVEVDIEFGESSRQSPNPDNPFTFLEISSNTTGEFINSSGPRSKWVQKTRAASDPSDENPPGGTISTSSDSQPSSDEGPLADPSDPTDGTPETQRDPTVPVTIVVPQTEWTVKWNQIPFAYLQSTLIHRMRWALGRVNSLKIPVLFDAYPETILFTGYNISMNYTWRSGNIGTPPVNVEFKFVEKRVVWQGVIRTHNDFWRPGKGWQRILIDGTNPAYEARDLRCLFSR